MNWTLEVIVVPVSDLERAEEFYASSPGREPPALDRPLPDRIVSSTAVTRSDGFPRS
jgi:hypothetical protein